MKRIAAVSLLLGLSLAVVFGFVGFSRCACQAGERANKTASPQGKESSRKDIQWLVFSATEHQRERQMVMKHEYITPKYLKAGVGRVYIALADLKDDGVQEIFAYTEGGNICGTMGCPFNIYQIKGQGLVSLLGLDGDSLPIDIDFDKKGRQNVFGVLPSKTMGWRDIARQDDENLWRWSWKGKHYGNPQRLD